MNAKRVLAAALVTASLATSLPVLPAEAANLSSFPDIADAQVAEAAEFLRAVDVVNGLPGGNYHPTGTLTRAEFCKMAICALGIGDREPVNRGRTIYLDVGPTHWARGYINLAASYSPGGEENPSPLVTGLGDGTFQPDRPITYAEAVAILCRVLNFGLSDISAGHHWYDGYLDAGQAAGLTDRLTSAPTSPISRGDAAILFYNLYFSTPKGEETSYLVSRGGQEIPDSILLDVNADHDRAVVTNQGTYPSRRPITAAYEGRLGTLILDENKHVLTFCPNSGLTQKTVHIRTVSMDSVTTVTGEILHIRPDTKLYTGDQTTTWEQGFTDARPYAGLTFHYTTSGVLSHLFLSTQTTTGETDAMIAMDVPDGHVDPFSALANGDDYMLLRNGSPAQVSDLRQYDVAVYDAAAHVMSVSDLRITGALTDFEPQTGLPELPQDVTAVTVMGRSFQLLPQARQSLSRFRKGSHVTLLLTADLQAAAIVPADDIPANATGFLQLEDTPEYDAQDGTASGRISIHLFPSGIILNGTGSMDGDSFRNGQLVSVVSVWSYTDEAGVFQEVMHLAPLPRALPSGDFSLSDRTIGGITLAPGALIFDHYADGPLFPVPYESLTGKTIPADRISALYRSSGGQIQYVVLNDGTGDLWSYGIPRYFPSAPNQNIPAHWRLNRADDKGGSIYQPISGSGELLLNENEILADVPGGIIVSQDNELGFMVRYKKLSTVRNVPRTFFDSGAMTVQVNGKTYPIAKDVQIFDNADQSWFIPGITGLNEARTKAEKLSIFYDRDPSQGGKIRVVTIN